MNVSGSYEKYHGKFEITLNGEREKKRGKKEKKRNTAIQDYLTLLELSFPAKYTFFLKLFQNENSRYIFQSISFSYKKKFLHNVQNYRILFKFPNTRSTRILTQRYIENGMSIFYVLPMYSKVKI